jgi:GcrA cell cycle regulator
MSWTDERVETLTKMWKDGRSAAEIAKELGGVTRNAVIGKAHRLGLSGRSSPIKKKAKDDTKKTAKTTTAKKTAAAKKPAAKKKAGGEKKVASAAQQKIIAEAIKEAVAEVDRELEGGVALLDLTEKLCRWPIGDPQESDFHFCGLASMPNLPYCEEHAAEAYQTPRKQQGSKTRGALKLVGDAKGAGAKGDDDDDDDLDVDDVDVDAIDDIDDDDDDDTDALKNAK